MMTNWWAILLLLTVAGGASAAALVDAPTSETTAATATEETTTQAPRKAEVVVIDVTRNTSSVVLIPINILEGDNFTSAEAPHSGNITCLRCLTQHKANIFMLVHLNRNWRQKLHFVRQLLLTTYEQSSINVAIVFFNEFTNIMATFGTAPLRSQDEILQALDKVQSDMERDESAAVSEHWTHFRLDDALKASYRYANLFLHQFSLDARPSILFSYFDDGAVISDATLKAVEQVLLEYKSTNPFKASISVLQWPSNLPVPPQWAKVSELLSSSPSNQVTGSNEDKILGLVADLMDKVCNDLPNA